MDPQTISAIATRAMTALRNSLARLIDLRKHYLVLSPVAFQLYLSIISSDDPLERQWLNLRFNNLVNRPLISTYDGTGVMPVTLLIPRDPDSILELIDSALTNICYIKARRAITHPRYGQRRIVRYLDEIKDLMIVYHYYYPTRFFPSWLLVEPIIVDTGILAELF